MTDLGDPNLRCPGRPFRLRHKNLKIYIVFRQDVILYHVTISLYTCKYLYILLFLLHIDVDDGTDTREGLPKNVLGNTMSVYIDGVSSLWNLSVSIPHFTSPLLSPFFSLSFKTYQDNYQKMLV